MHIFIATLKEAGHSVTGVDLNLFEESPWEKEITPDKEFIKDFRDLTFDELESYDCVMHLAAISNDPMGDLVEQLTYDVNLHGSIDLAKKAKEAGCTNISSGSCSVYGKGEIIRFKNRKLKVKSSISLCSIKS